MPELQERRWTAIHLVLEKGDVLLTMRRRVSRAEKVNFSLFRTSNEQIYPLTANNLD